MEDYELIRSLRKEGRIVLLPQKAVTSARKWRANGVWRTTFMNMAVTWLYQLGVSPERLIKWYREKLRVER